MQAQSIHRNILTIIQSFIFHDDNVHPSILGEYHY